MVVFNPQVAPTNDPNWTNVSRPISDLPGDKSKALAISGAAEVLDSSVRAADMLTKQSIDSDVHEKVDTLRDAYTEGLKSVRNIQIAQGQQTLLPDGGDGAGGGGDTPPGLQQGLDRVQQIGTAMAQNPGKINDTLYTGALNSMAKQLRNSYPGYRDYIDEKIKSVSGVDPANAFMRNLMEDINMANANNKTEINATKSMLREGVKNGFHDVNGVSAAQMLEAYDRGILTTAQVNKWYNGANKIEFDQKQRAAARSERQADDVDAAKNAQKDLSTTTNEIVNHGWSTMTLGKGTDTAEGLFKFIQANQGNQNIKDERSQAIGQQLVGLRAQMFKQAWAKANEGGANSMVAKLGGDPDKAKAVINGQLSNMDNAIEAVFNKQWGAAYSHMNFNKAITEDSKNLMYNASDEEVRRYNRMIAAINDISPQAGALFLQQSILGGVPKNEMEFLKMQKLELLTQPDENVGSLISAKGQIAAAKARGAVSPKTYSDLIDTVNIIADPKWDKQNRVNVARGFFDPQKNQGLLSDENFKKDYTRPDGSQVPGKYSVFSRLSNPAVAKSIADLQRPDISTDYRVMMEREFGEQLFSRDLRDLGQDNANASANKGYKIAYVSEKGEVPRFDIVHLDGRPMMDTEALAVRAPVAAKNRLNSGIAGLHTVYANTGSKDPNTDLFNTMSKYGYQVAGNPRDLSQGWSGEASDLPKMFWNSLIAAQQDRLRKAGEAMRKNQ